MIEEKRSFWSTYVFSPIKRNKDTYSYIKDDIYQEIICDNELVFEQELKNFQEEITFVSRAGDETYQPAVSLSEEKKNLKEALKSDRKSMGMSVLMLAAYFYLAFGVEDDMGFGQLRIVLLLFSLPPFARTIQKLIQLKNLERGNEHTLLENVQFHYWLNQGSFQIVWLLPVILAICFVGQLIAGYEDAIALFGLVKPIEDGSSLYRLISAAFIHGSIMHVFFNASFLLSISSTFLKMASYGRLMLTFLVTAVIGSLFSLLLYPETTSVGASGGILGVYGFILAIALKNKDIIPSDFKLGLFINIGFIAILGLGAIEIIDNGAHLGGFLGGLGIGMFYSKESLLARIKMLHVRDTAQHEKYMAEMAAAPLDKSELSEDAPPTLR